MSDDREETSREPAAASPAVVYAERLTVPLRWWVQSVMFLATVWLATVVALPFWLSTVVTGLACAVVAWLLAGYGAARVVVADGELRAGRAHISLSLLGDPEALDATATRRVAGVDADARAHLLLRGYLKQSVRVPVLDPADPTPYWLVSTRRPVELARALAQARRAPGD